jgi:hypothetical protein
VGSILRKLISAEKFSDQFSSSDFGQSSTKNSRYYYIKKYLSIVGNNLGFYGILNPAKGINANKYVYDQSRFYP